MVTKSLALLLLTALLLAVACAAAVDGFTPGTPLPATSDTGDCANTGSTIRNAARDHYLRMAQILYDEMIKDGVLAGQ